MTDEEKTITQAMGLLKSLKTPYVFIVRQDRAIRNAIFPNPEEAGELLARAAKHDPEVKKIMAEAIKIIQSGTQNSGL